AAALYAGYAVIFKPHGGDLRSLATGPMAKLVVDAKPGPQPIQAQGPDGKPVKVLPISLDKGDDNIAKARAFIADKAPLGFYHGDYALAFAIKPATEG